MDVRDQADQYFDQTVNLVEAGNYFFTLDYFAHEPPSKFKFEILFNGNQIADVVPTNKIKNTVTATVSGIVGANVLRLKNKS